MGPWQPQPRSTSAQKGRIVFHGEQRPLRRVLSNSFGFGGNNCSLVLGTPA